MRPLSDTWIGANDVYARAGVTTASGTGQLGGFGLTVKSRFKRSNPPFERAWSPDGTNQAAYRMGPELSAAWLQLRGGDIGPVGHEEAARESGGDAVDGDGHATPAS